MIGSRLKDKSALVTGGGRGIGRAIALSLAREGATVAIADLNQESAGRVADEIKRMGITSVAIAADFSDMAEVPKVITAVVAALGGIDILVNNAGRAQPKPMLDLTPADWETIMAVNAEAPFFCLQAAAKQMIKQGRGGRIVNIASAAGKAGFPDHLHYAASKACVISITRTAAKGLAEYGILVNCVCPGIIDTDMWRELDASYTKMRGLRAGQVFEQTIARALLGRAGTPEDVANVVTFLCTHESSYMTGQAINVTGGMLQH